MHTALPEKNCLTALGTWYECVLFVRVRAVMSNERNVGASVRTYNFGARPPATLDPLLSQFRLKSSQPRRRREMWREDNQPLHPAHLVPHLVSPQRTQGGIL